MGPRAIPAPGPLDLDWKSASDYQEKRTLIQFKRTNCVQSEYSLNKEKQLTDRGRVVMVLAFFAVEHRYRKVCILLGLLSDYTFV